MSTPAAEETNSYPARSDVIKAMPGLMALLFLASLDQTIVATALVSIGQDLNGLHLAPWVIVSYLVASIAVTPILAKLGDIYGRRPVLILTASAFILTSLLCSLAQSMPQLIAARILQGVSGGGIRVLAMASLGDLVAPRHRGIYTGYFTTAFATATVIGPLLGGFIADHLSWHWIFALNFPIGLFAISNCATRLNVIHHIALPRRIDWLGSLLLMLVAIPLLLGVSAIGNSSRLFDLSSLPFFGVALVALPALLAWEHNFSEPVMPLKLFAIRNFNMAIILTFSAAILLTGLIATLPLHYQLGLGQSASAAGIHIIPLMGGSILGSFMAGRAVSFIGSYRLILIFGSSGMLLTSVAAAGFLGMDRWLDVGLLGVMGLAIGCHLSPTTIIAQSSVAKTQIGVAIGYLMFFRFLGGAVGVAILTTALTVDLPTHGSIPPYSAGLPIVFVITTVFSAIALAAALGLIGKPLESDT